MVERFRWGDIVKYKNKSYFIVEEKKKVIRVRQIIESTGQVGYNIISIPNLSEVRLVE